MEREGWGPKPECLEIRCQAVEQMSSDGEYFSVSLITFMSGAVLFILCMYVISLRNKSMR